MKLRILLLEDRAADAELVERQLRRGGIDPVITRVETEEAFRDCLLRQPPDVILADYQLPTFDGLSGLVIARDLAPAIPFVFVSGSIGDERAVEALRMGATDYVLKDRLTRLPSAVTRVMAESVDLVRRRTAEAALQQAERRFRCAMMATHDVIWEWDVVAGTIWTNRMHGPGSESTEPFDDVIERIHPDDREKVRATIRDVRASKAVAWSLEYRIAAADGSWRIMADRQVILRDEEGRAVRVIGAGMDVTERRRAEEVRDRLARRNELLLNSVQEGICGTDLDDHIIFANASAARLLGYEMEELLGKSMHDVAHHSRPDGSPLPASECRVLRTSEFGEARAYHTVYFRRDGTPFPVEIDTSRVMDDGRFTGLVVTFCDVSERRQLERQLDDARRINDLGRVAATMAHEFNNVLMGMQPFIEILSRPPAEPSVARIAQQLGRLTQRGKAVTQELLRFANDSDLDLVPIAVTPWLEALTEELRVLLGSVELRVEASPEPLHILGDSSALQQVMTNLVINARDAMPDGGTVTIRVRRFDEAKPLPFAIAFRPDEALYLCVSDTGTGMSAEVLERAFEPMFTTKLRGNGLGLAYAHRAVTRHGGQIFVVSTAGEGTTFHIILPLTAERAAEAVTAPEATNIRARLLIVEDDPDVAEATAVALQWNGLTVKVVSTGAAVEPAIERFGPDIVLLDVGLPDESGFSVYARISTRWPALPVIFASGHIVEQQVPRHLGPNTASLTKPYAISALMALFARLLPAPDLPSARNVLPMEAAGEVAWPTR
jgi:PAS domain S-box-containing protein